MAKKESKPIFNIKIDDTLLNLIKDYHSINPTETVVYFYDLCEQMIEVKGNICNKDRKPIKYITKKQPNVIKWRTINPNGSFHADDFNAYVLRGFYPGTKIPFKISGVNQGSMHGWACFKIMIGDKDKHTNFTNEKLNKIEQLMADAILLDKKPEDLDDDVYKVKPFKCMRPKGLPLLSKAKNIIK